LKETKRKIYIGYGNNSDPIWVIIAKNREQAETVGASMKEISYSIEEIDLDEAEGVQGLVILLTSHEKEAINKYGLPANFKYRQWKRGR